MAKADYEFTVSLRVRHPGIAPSEITRSLGIEPQHTWRRGDSRRESVTGELSDGTYRESYWMARLMDEPQLSSETVSVEAQLRKTLTQLGRTHEFLSRIAASGGIVELHVSLYARQDFRLELSSELLTLLGRMGLSIAVDVHPHDVATLAATGTN